MRIADDIVYVGVDDHEIDLFEGQYAVPNGMSYNSYVITGAGGAAKTAVMDSVDAAFGQQWLDKLAAALDGVDPDYLVVHHMEPDHSANIVRFMEAYPHARMVSSAKSFTMLEGFYGRAYEDRRVVVKGGDVLDLGSHALEFIAAPMVHWPEVLMSYDRQTGMAFTADAFGKFGALDVEDDWVDEARRYYFGICGKFGKQVGNALAKLDALEVKGILPLHGPVLLDDLDRYRALYRTWAAYEVESPGVVIAYASIYGNTKQAVELLESELLEAGCPNVSVHDLARDDLSNAVEDAFRYGSLVLACPTVNADMFPAMKTFLDHLADHNYQNRTVALVENTSFAPAALRTMKAKLEGMKGIELVDPQVSVKGGLSDESREQIRALAAALRDVNN